MFWLSTILNISKLNIEPKAQFANKKFFVIMMALIVTLLIDTAFVKINDLIDKNFMPIQSKIGLFSVNELYLFVITVYNNKIRDKFLWKRSA